MTTSYASEELARESRRLDRAATVIASTARALDHVASGLGRWKGDAARHFTATKAKDMRSVEWLASAIGELGITVTILGRVLDGAELLRSRATVLALRSGCTVDPEGNVRLQVGLPEGSLPVQGQNAARMLQEARELAEQASRRAASDFDLLAEMLERGPPEFVAEDPEPEGTWGVRDSVGLAADVAGIADPTPVSDSVSGLLDLSRGDFVGAALSVVAAVPWLGDALAKPVDIARNIKRGFPALEHLGHGRTVEAFVQLVRDTLRHVDLRNPKKAAEALSTLNAMHRKATAAYGRNASWVQKAKQLKLPTEGPIVFAPPKNWGVARPPKTVARGNDGRLYEGYRDAFDNVWLKGKGRGGDAREWDVQTLPKSGLSGLTKDGKHLNVGFDGRVTH